MMLQKGEAELEEKDFTEEKSECMYCKQENKTYDKYRIHERKKY